MCRKRASILVLGAALILSAAADGVLAGPAVEYEGPGMLNLALPRPVAAGEAMHLHLSAGHLPPGAEILVRTMEGDVLGGVSPFGARQRAGPATFSIPVPESAVRDGRLELRLEVLEPGAPTRPPTASELGAVHLEFVKVTD